MFDGGGGEGTYSIVSRHWIEVSSLHGHTCVVRVPQHVGVRFGCTVIVSTLDPITSAAVERAQCALEGATPATEEDGEATEADLDSLVEFIESVPIEADAEASSTSAVGIVQRYLASR